MILNPVVPQAPPQLPPRETKAPEQTVARSAELGALLHEVHEESLAEQRRQAEELAKLRALADRD